MKKYSVFTIAAIALLFVACNKDITVQVSPATVEKTFTVTAPSDTKTALSGTKAIVWSADDEINVIAKTTGNQYTFNLTKGAGTASASFSGTIEEADAAETEFYALYPNVKAKPDFSNDKLGLNSIVNDVQTAVKDGYDPNSAIMTGVVDNNTIAFRHGMAYFKIKIGTEGVYSVNLKTSNSRFAGRPVYIASTGAYSSIESATGKDNITLKPSEGTFEKDAVYYIPVPVKNSKIGTLTITYTFDAEGSATNAVSTAAKKDDYLELGKIYDLGCPNITYTTEPVLTLLKTQADNIPADAATGLTIESAYSLKNCTDSDVTVTPDGTVVTAASISGGTVTYTISENTGDAREGTISLKLGSADAQVITIKQVAAGTATELVNVTTTTTWNAENTWAPLANDKGTDAVKSDFLFNNLGFLNGDGSGFKFADTRVQLAGTGTAGTKLCLQFKVGGPGTVTITCQSGNKTTDRTLKVALGNNDKGSISAPASGNDGSVFNTGSVVISNAVAGNFVNIYSGGSGINITEVTWTPSN